MGRPEGESSEMQSTYDQPGLDTDPTASYYDPTMQQDQPDYNNPPPPVNDQPAPPPPPHHQQQTFSRAPMPNPGPAQYPPGPAQYPPPGPQMNPTAYPPQQPAAYPPQQPAAYPPPPAAFPPQQNGQPPSAYPPQKPVMFPPPSPQQAQQYPPPPSPQQAQQYPPPPPQANFQPVQFPPPGQQMGYGGQMPPQSPVKPAAHGIPIQMTMPNSEGWRTGLFDCLEDPTNAAITLFFPCLTFGQIAEIVDNGQTSCATGALMYFLITSFIGLPCIYSCTYRTKLRSKFGLVEAPAPDWVVHFLCEACALCQAYRELNHRGLDPSIGWIGNVARSQQQQQQMTMMPPQPQRMM